MNSVTVHWRSLKTRVTLFTLAIFFIGIWSLTFYTSRLLRDDFKGLLSEQQFSTASLLAAEIDQELSDRLHALEITAREIGAATLNDPVALQALLENRPLLLGLFNDGIASAGLAGTVLADFPHVPGRVGANFIERDYISGPLKTDKATIGKPVRSKLTQDPSFVMAVPIKDAAGRAIGVLAGVINLSKPNFLNLITEGKYGRHGDYFLVAPQHRLNVSSSNKSRIMATLPAPGVSPALDRQAQGFEGTQVFINPLGFEVLTSVKQIPSAGWYVAITLATEKAFAPIEATQRRMLLAAFVLSLLAAALTWLTLRHQLAPLMDTVKTLARVPESNEFPIALPITRPDEVGRLIASFNQLLSTLKHREVALLESEERFRTLIEWTPEALAVHRDGKILYVNPSAIKMMGATSAQDLIGLPILDLVHPDFRQTVMDRIKESTDQSKPLPMIEEKLVRFDGSVIDVEVTGIAIRYDGKPAIQVAMRDITLRKQRNLALRESEERLRLALDAAQIGEWELDLVTQQARRSPKHGEIYGQAAPLPQWSVKAFLDLVHPDDRARVALSLQESATSAQDWHEEFRIVRHDQAVRWVWSRGHIFKDENGRPLKMIGMNSDITERRQAEAALQSSLQEKVALLNEVHHRVKNNLQVITSLLRLEAGRSTEPDTRSVLTDMQGRIRSMALLHESLYRSGTFASVDLSVYLKQLANQSFRAQVSSNNLVRLQLDLASVQVSLDRATPCGLLVNELISNGLKHGFPEGRSGEIRIELHAAAAPSVAPATEGGAAQWCLRVSDTGVGLPADFEARRAQSLGLQLVSDLAGQLGGTLEIGSGPGAVFTVMFTTEVPQVFPPTD